MNQASGESRAAVFLTGACGFLGAQICRELAARGRILHALARESSDRSALQGLDVHWHSGDLRDSQSLERALQKVCAVHPRPQIVHAGALISYRRGDAAAAEAINVEGTRSLLELCKRYPVGRFLHVSSVVTIGPAQSEEVCDEDSPYVGESLRCDYMSTKYRAEQLAQAAAAELDLVIVNPGAIFGTSARASNSQRVLAMIASGRTGPLPLLLAPPGAQSVVGLEDCAQGCVLALERGARAQRYLLVESVWTHPELIGLVARRLGRRAPLSIPRWLWAIVEASGPLEGVLRSEFFTAQTLRLARVRFAMSGARARRELGWKPRPFEQVIERMLEASGLKPSA
jgi:dihydroflavonol-4-reductase